MLITPAAMASSTDTLWVPRNCSRPASVMPPKPTPNFSTSSSESLRTSRRQARTRFWPAGLVVTLGRTIEAMSAGRLISATTRAGAPGPFWPGDPPPATGALSTAEGRLHGALDVFAVGLALHLLHHGLHEL